MPLPLKPGYNFNFAHIRRPPHYEMSAAEAYTDFYGISYMISGERLIYGPDYTTLTQAGELNCIPRYEYRRTTYISDTPYEHILIKFTDSMVAELFGIIGADSYEELCQEHVIWFEQHTQDKIYGILLEMEQEWNAYSQYSELLLKGLLNQLIITCLQERIISDVKVLSLEKRHDCLANAIKYVKSHLRENPSLNTTARQINISPSYLSRIFVTYLHTPFSTFVLNEKMAYAQKLLVHSKLSMTEVAIEAGFSSSSYFSDCFRRNTGMSPLQFRKENGAV